MRMLGTALVTGGSSGIGLELARRLASKGYRLIMVAQNQERLAAAADTIRKEWDVEVIALAKDLADSGAPEEIVREIRGLELEVDVLVNNAGFAQGGRFYRMDPHQIERMMAVNIGALTRLTRLILPDMVLKGKGKILNLASLGSFVPGPYNAVYCASKAYVLSLSRALAVELRGTGVTVTALCPGSTRTRFAATANMEDTLLFKVGVMEPKQVAKAGYQAMERGRTVTIPGLITKKLVFLTRLFPMNLTAAVSGMIQKRRKRD